MNSLMPVHNALVHVPLGLAVALPLAASILALGAWGGRTPRLAWGVLVALQALLVAGAALAMSSGDAVEDTAETRGATESSIEQHEERAEIFTWLAGASLAVAVAALAGFGTRARKPLVLAATLATLPVAGAAAWTGAAGGRIAHPSGDSHAIAAPTLPSDKWLADEHTADAIEEMEGLIASSRARRGGTLADHASLGAALRLAVDDLIRGCRMTGPAHEELHAFLTTFIPRVRALAAAANLADGKAALLRVDESLAQFHVRFESPH